MDRSQKSELVGELNQLFSGIGCVVVTKYVGLSVAEMTDLRARLREAGAGYRVTKNRLTKIALEGTPCAPLSEYFTGPTAIGYSDDPVAAPKVLVDFAKENEKLQIIGGIMGQTLLDTGGVKALATLPSLDELRAKLIGMLNTPAIRIARVLNAPGEQVARVIQAYADKGEAA